MHLSEKQIKNLVNDPYFSRGKEYFLNGMIKITSMTDNDIKGKAVGSAVYNVRLVLKKDMLEGRCTCPAFYDFGPCKHIAAVGLAAIAQKEGKFYKAQYGKTGQLEEFEKFEKSLYKKSKNELVGLIIEMCGLYPEIINDFMEYDSEEE